MLTPFVFSVLILVDLFKLGGSHTQVNLIGGTNIYSKELLVVPRA